MAEYANERVLFNVGTARPTLLLCDSFFGNNSFFGTHSLRPTKAAVINGRAGNLGAVQLLFGRRNIEGRADKLCPLLQGRFFQGGDIKPKDSHSLCDQNVGSSKSLVLPAAIRIPRALLAHYVELRLLLVAQ